MKDRIKPMNRQPKSIDSYLHIVLRYVTSSIASGKLSNVSKVKVFAGTPVSSYIIRSSLSEQSVFGDFSSRY